MAIRYYLLLSVIFNVHCHPLKYLTLYLSCIGTLFWRSHSDTIYILKLKMYLIEDVLIFVVWLYIH